MCLAFAYTLNIGARTPFFSLMSKCLTSSELRKSSRVCCCSENLSVDFIVVVDLIDCISKGDCSQLAFWEAVSLVDHTEFD